MKSCAISDCTNDADAARGWCWMHYQRNRLHGSPHYQPQKVEYDPVCAVENCLRPSNTRGYCKMHYMRLLRNGDPGPPGPRQPSTFLTTQGYPARTDSKHPLAERSGRLLIHREILWDKHGRPDQSACEYCGTTLNWHGAPKVTADHVDFDRTNNDPSNLVVSCISCNVRRARERQYASV